MGRLNGAKEEWMNDDFALKASAWDADPIKVERAQVVAAAIRTQVNFTAKLTAFEYGCGTGLLSFALQSALAHITLADSSAGMLAVLAQKIADSGVQHMTPMKLDIVTDPLPAARYDLIYTLLTLHHIPGIDACLSAFYTLLKPQGRLCIADLDKEDGSFHGPGFTGHHGFDRNELAARLTQAGFQKLRFSTVYNLTRMTATGPKTFPLFLLIAEKEAAAKTHDLTVT
jgi:ubiquinone/menaquinone biosynthesis C-methylase UbiE